MYFTGNSPACNRLPSARWNIMNSIPVGVPVPFGQSVEPSQPGLTNDVLFNWPYWRVFGTAGHRLPCPD